MPPRNILGPGPEELEAERKRRHVAIFGAGPEDEKSIVKALGSAWKRPLYESDFATKLGGTTLTRDPVMKDLSALFGEKERVGLTRLVRLQALVALAKKHGSLANAYEKSAKIGEDTKIVVKEPAGGAVGGAMGGAVRKRRPPGRLVGHENGDEGGGDEAADVSAAASGELAAAALLAEGYVAKAAQEEASTVAVGVAASPLSRITPTPVMRLSVSEVTAAHTQVAHIYNAKVIRERNLSYSCHMKVRSPELAEGCFDPTAVLADKLMVITAQMIGTLLEGVVAPAGLDAEFFSSAVLAAFSHSFRVLLVERGLTAAAPMAAAPMADVPMADVPMADVPMAAAPMAAEQTAAALMAEVPMLAAEQTATTAEQTATVPADRYERLAHAATGVSGLSGRRIAQKMRDDVRRDGKPFMRFVTGMRTDTGALDEVQRPISDEGKAAHQAAAAYLLVEAARRITEATPEERLVALRREKVAHAGHVEAVIGKDGLRNGKGQARIFSRSFLYSLVRSDEHGAILRSIGTDEEEELKTGPIGDEWTFDEVDALLDDERVPPELKALLRLSDAMLVESELAEAELILRYISRSVRMVKPVGSPCVAVPQRPIIHSWAMSGAASIFTFDADDSHLTRTGYCHVTSRFPSFEFDICDMAMTPAGDWPMLPTSLQSGGDAYIMDSNRAGELTMHGGRGPGRLLDLTADEARAAAASEGLELVLSSSNNTGFKGVTKNEHGTYVVQVRENGKTLYLGIFTTPEEGALCYARRLGAERAAAEAAEARGEGPRGLTADEARAAAAAEGLELVLSSSTNSGFEGVCMVKTGKYTAKVKENHKILHLGTFATKEEAALCYARRVKEYRVWAEAAEAAAEAAAGHHVKKQKA